MRTSEWEVGGVKEREKGIMWALHVTPCYVTWPIALSELSALRSNKKLYRRPQLLCSSWYSSQHVAQHPLTVWGQVVTAGLEPALSSGPRRPPMRSVCGLGRLAAVAFAACFCGHEGFNNFWHYHWKCNCNLIFKFGISISITYEFSVIMLAQWWT